MLSVLVLEKMLRVLLTRLAFVTRHLMSFDTWREAVRMVGNDRRQSRIRRVIGFTISHNCTTCVCEYMVVK